MGSKFFNITMTILGVIVYIFLGLTIFIPTIATQLILNMFFHRVFTTLEVAFPIVLFTN